MNNYKIMTIIVAFLLVCMSCMYIVMGVSSQVNSFYGQTNPLNITFTENQNQSFNLSVPLYAYINNMSFSINKTNYVGDVNLSVYLNETKIYSSSSFCYQENATESTACGGLDTGAYYSTLGENSLNTYDGNYATQGESNAGIQSLYINYTKPSGMTSVLWQVKDGGALANLTIPTDCINAFTDKIVLRVDSDNGVDIEWLCYNSSTDTHLLRLDATNDDIYEEGVFWNIPTNLTEYSIKDDVSSIIQNGCDCIDCVISSSNCLIPITLNLDGNATLMINLTSSTYNYGIDNCSNSFNIPSNATSYIFNFQDYLYNPVNINLSHSLLYAGNNYASQSNNISNFSYCIYPKWLNITDDIFLQMYYGSSLFTFFSTGTIFDNTTNYLNMTIDIGTTSVTAYVYDSTGNALEEAYIDTQRYEPTTGNYVSIGSYATNFEGSVAIPIIKTTTLYRFYIYYPIGTLRESTNPTYINSDTISFYIDTGEDYLEDYFLTQNMYSSLTYNNLTNNLRYEYSDSTASVSQACVKLYRLQGVGSTLIDTSCNSGSSGTILLSVDNITGTTYLGKSFVYVEGQEIPMNSLSIDFPSTDAKDTIGIMGLFIDILVTISFAFIFFFSIPLAIILIPLPTVMLSSIGFLAIDPAIAWGIEVAALVLAFIINKRD